MAQLFVSMKTIREGDKGEDVEVLQERLVALGYGIKKDGKFNVATKQSVMDFQRKHNDQNGLPLVVDGIVGPETWWALYHEEKSAKKAGKGTSAGTTVILLVGLGIAALLLMSKTKS